MKHSLYIIMTIAATAFAGCGDDRYVAVVHGDNEADELLSETEDAEPTCDKATYPQLGGDCQPDVPCFGAWACDINGKLYCKPEDDCVKNPDGDAESAELEEAEAAEETTAETDNEQSGCIADEKRCNGETLEKCQNGKWVFQTDCTYTAEKCKENQCVACIIGEKGCGIDGFMNAAKICIDNHGVAEWQLTDVCDGDTPVCLNGECLKYNPNKCLPTHCQGTQFAGTPCKTEKETVNEYCECAEGYWWSGSDCVDTKNPCEQWPCTGEHERNCGINALGKRFCDCFTDVTDMEYYWDAELQYCRPGEICYGKCKGELETACYVHDGAPTGYVCKCKSGYGWNMTTKACEKIN